MKWGTSSGVYTKTVTATTSHVTKSQMCGAPANSTGWRDLGLIHQALMSGIQYTFNNGLLYGHGKEHDIGANMVVSVHNTDPIPLPSQSMCTILILFYNFIHLVESLIILH